MQAKRIAAIVMVVAALTLLLVTSSTVARPPVQGSKGSEEISLSGTVASRISYQGRLTGASGDPLNGQHNMVFQLWDHSTAGSQMGSNIVRSSVPVTNGLFTVELDVPLDVFNGQAVWLRVQVNGQWLSPRQALLAVPYALSLVPGARVLANTESPGFKVQQNGSGNALEGVLGPRHPTSGNAVYGESALGNGVYGRSVQSRGVYGLSELNDGVAGRTESQAKSGVFGYSPVGIGVTGHSDGNHGVQGVTSSTDHSHAGVFARNNGAGPAIYSDGKVYIRGDLQVTGSFYGDIAPNGGAPFPRPAYDSGWRSIAKDQSLTLQHGIGGDPDNYVVDLQFKGAAHGRHQYRYGGDQWRYEYLTLYWNQNRGAFWHLLTSQTIMVSRLAQDEDATEIRVRIWAYW